MSRLDGRPGPLTEPERSGVRSDEDMAVLALTSMAELAREMTRCCLSVWTVDDMTKAMHRGCGYVNDTKKPAKAMLCTFSHFAVLAGSHDWDADAAGPTTTSFCKMVTR